MSDMPDFDSMSPEEMMEWMESLAKRQGAAEGFTTDASLEIEEVAEDDERLAGAGEYIPYGMSEEEWAVMQEREAAQKAERLAAMNQAPATPPEVHDPPEAVASQSDPHADASATADDTPDFDSMSQEEMMEWMESLAKRQGGDESGFLTQASMDIAEVDENDERLEGMGEYKPYGMSDDDWEALQAREAAQKAERQAQSEALSTESEYDYVEEDEYEYVEEDEYDYVNDDSQEYITYDEDEETAYEYDEDDEEYADEELVRANLDVLGIEESPVEEDALAFDNLFDDSQAADDAAPVPEAASNPMDWLSSLSNDDDTPPLDLGLDGLGDLASLGASDAEAVSENPMDWLASLSNDDSSTELEEFSALVDANEAEGTLEWMESLAKRQDAAEDELVTAANLDIPQPELAEEDGPGYEEFSFEEATGIVQDTDQTPAIQALHEIEDDSDTSLEDPEAWLDDLASGVASERDRDDDDELMLDDIFAGDNVIAAAEQVTDTASDETEDDTFDTLAENVKSQMASGKLGDSPEDVDMLFRAAFSKAANRDVPDYDYDETDDTQDTFDDEPLQAEIPDWLQESMASTDDTPTATDTAELMIDGLDLDNDLDESALPDWLSGGIENDTGDIAEDIFADEILDEEVLQEADALEDASMTIFDVRDTQDNWVEAFTQEDSGELATWYENAISNLEETDDMPRFADADMEEITEFDDVPDTSIVLQAAEFDYEATLPEGTPQVVPDWMSLQAAPDGNQEMVAISEDSMDWLDEDVLEMSATETSTADADMPDWLLETVDDSATQDEGLPDWLEGETELTTEDIPAWLRETMDEESEVVASVFVVDEDDNVVAEPEPQLPVAVIESPAPVPVNADRIDAVAFMRSAKQKTDAGDIEGGMLDYEQVIRANKALPQVEKALQKLIDDTQYKRNPTINRVMGDVLMRQGKLQQALDIYRKALNML